MPEPVLMQLARSMAVVAADDITPVADLRRTFIRLAPTTAEDITKLRRQLRRLREAAEVVESMGAELKAL